MLIALPFQYPRYRTTLEFLGKAAGRRERQPLKLFEAGRTVDKRRADSYKIQRLLGDRLMVGLQSLDLPIGVRIPVSQPTSFYERMARN